MIYLRSRKRKRRIGDSKGYVCGGLLNTSGRIVWLKLSKGGWGGGIGRLKGGGLIGGFLGGKCRLLEDGGVRGG